MAPENFDDSLYIVNRGFFTTVEHTTRRYAFQAFPSFHLTYYKCPERHFHSEIREIDRYTLVSAILIIPVTLAPLTGFHASKRQDAGIHIRSRPVVPDDYNLARTTEVTPKVVLWTSEVLLNHRIFPKIPILLYDVHFTRVWVLHFHLKR